MSNDLRSTIRGVQGLLNLDPKATAATKNGVLDADGIVGRETRLAYAAASPETRALVEAELQRQGFNNSVLSATRRVRKVLTSEQMHYIEKWCKYWGVDPSLALTFVSAESGFDQEAYNLHGGAWGLLQITVWAVKQLEKDKPSVAPTRPRDWRDLDFNCCVGIYYIAWCADRARVPRNTTNPRHWADIYGYYNLGVGAYGLIKRGEFTHPTVTKNLATQAAPLRKGGASNYVSNVLAYISQHSVA